MAVRNIRRDANESFKKLEKTDESVSEDTVKELQEEIQKLTDKYIREIDARIETKTKELMTV